MKRHARAVHASLARYERELLRVVPELHVADDEPLIEGAQARDGSARLAVRCGEIRP
jgi:hypothetical protein